MNLSRMLNQILINFIDLIMNKIIQCSHVS